MSAPRRSPFLLAALAVGLVALGGCRKQKGPGYDVNVVATVNGELISRADFARELTRDLQSVDPVTPRSPEQVAPARKALLDDLIERTLLLQAARKANITVSPEEVDRRVLRISADYPAEGFDAALAHGQLSMAELKRKTAQLLTIEKLFEEQIYPRVALTEEEIRQYFEKHPEEFAHPEEVRAEQIVVKTLEEARHLQQLLRQGKKFSDLARKYSLSADAKVGGDLGFFPRGVMPPEFDAVAFRLAAGQVSDVVTTPYGFHLFKVLEKKPAYTPELGEVRKKVEEKLLAQKRREAQQAFVAALKKNAKITINEPVLESITAP